MIELKLDCLIGQIEAHFQRVAREQQIKQKLRESMKQYGVNKKRSME